MISLVLNNQMRPNRVTDQKNLTYHLNCARYFTGSLNRQKYQYFLRKCMVNWKFYEGDQWIFKEDLAPFLKDESGEVRNRIKWVENIVRPMVDMLVNNAILTDYTYKVQAHSPFAVNRREEEMNKMLTLAEMGKLMGGQMQKLIKDNFLVGDTLGETQDMFSQRYADKLAMGINYLMDYYDQINNIEDLKVAQAKNFAITGLVVSREYEHHGNQVHKSVIPETFFWDLDCTMSHLYDGDFMGNWTLSTPVSLYERYENIKSTQKDAIEKTVSQARFTDFSYAQQFVGNVEGRVPEVRVEWKDQERQIWGWVKEGGIETFVRIYKEGRYSKKDLIIPAKKERSSKLSSDRTLVKDVGVTRFCHFTPKEYLANSKDDIVYEWGVVPYSDQSYILPDDNPFTYKTFAYSYHDGMISAPIDDAINPQRLVNRIRSMHESAINNMRMPVMVYEEDNLGDGGEEELLRNVNLGKPVGLKNTGGNIQNAFRTVNPNSTPTINTLASAAMEIASAARNNLGFNDAVLGNIGGKRELAGVANQMMRQGSVMQEGFYYGIGKWLLQVHQSMAHRGKCIAINSGTIIYYSVGDKLAPPLILSKDYINEYFRIFVQRTPPESDTKNQANMLALQLYQLGLLDEARFSQVFGNGNLDDITRLMREYVGEKIQVQKEQSEIEMAAAAAGDMAGQGMQQQGFQNKLDVADMQNQGRVAQEMAKPRPTNQ